MFVLSEVYKKEEETVVKARYMREREACGRKTFSWPLVERSFVDGEESLIFLSYLLLSLIAKVVYMCRPMSDKDNVVNKCEKEWVH